MTVRSGALTRDDATRRVMKTVARTFESEPLPLRLGDGTQPLVVALPSEYISEIVNRVISIGGQANVAVAFNDHFTTIALGNKTAQSVHVLEINQDLSMGMFLIKLQQNPGKSMRLKFRDVDANVPEASLKLAYA